jgi:hypothetical protein
MARIFCFESNFLEIRFLNLIFRLGSEMETDTEHYALKWGDLPNEAFAAFRVLRDRGLFVDVAVSVSGEVFRAHQIVLVASSPYFERILVPFEAGPGACDLINRYPVLVMNDEDPTTFRMILDFIYRGETEVPSSSLSEFLRLAETLEVKGLKQGAESASMNVASSVNVGMSGDQSMKLTQIFNSRNTSASSMRSDWEDSRASALKVRAWCVE